MSLWWRQRSVRASMTAWYVGAMLAVLAVYAAAVFSFVSHNLSNALNDSLRGDYQWANAMADQRPDGSLRWFDDERNFGEDSPWLQVWSDGRVIFRTLTAERNPLADADTQAAHPEQGVVVVPGSTAPIRVLSTPSYLYGKMVVIQVAKSEAPMRRQLNQLLAFLALGLPLAVAVAGIGGYSLARRALAPVERMAERARSISAESLSDRLPVDNPDDELGHLATVFNETLGRLESSFDQMRRFTTDVSHELRTPLTAIRTVGEVGLREPRDADAYRGIIGSMLEEVDRLGSLVDRLLTLSRAEIGQARLTPEAVDLKALADDVVLQLGVLAEEKQQALGVDAQGKALALVDRAVLRQAVINLVDNAIKYTPHGGHISVRVSESPSAAILEVTDDGPGIDEGMRSRVFDRFYRAGGEHRADVGGTGLGLSIAKWAVEANRGRLDLEPGGEVGSTFRITVPRARSARGRERRRRTA